MSYKKYAKIKFEDFNSQGAKKSFQTNMAINKIQSEYIPSYDFRLGSNIYYGRIDSSNNVINVNEAYLENISQNKEKPIYCLNFVADAFKEMRRYIKFEARSKIVADNFLDSSWDAKKGWSSPHVFYDNAVRDLYDVFLKRALLGDKKETKIFNIEDFIEVFLNEFYINIDKNSPLSKSGTIMSKYFNPTYTGLCIETAEVGYSDGYSTIDEYFKSPNYEFYTLAASGHGFLIDKNSPWRLIANLNSPFMKKYMTNRGLTHENVFDTCYYKTYKYDIQNLQVYFLQMYYAYTSEFPIAFKENPRYSNQECPKDKQPKFLAVERKKPSRDEYNEQFNELFWLKLYYRVRLKEAAIKTPDTLLTREMIKLEQLYNTLDFDSALEYINNIIKQQMIWF